MKTFDIFNELSEYVSIKINSTREAYHPHTWTESKSHNDYDLWFLLEGEIIIETGGMTYAADSKDIVLFYPGMPYTARMGPKGARFIYIHFDYGIGNNFRILNDFPFSGILAKKAVGTEASIFKKGWYRCKNSPVSSVLFKGYFTILISKIMSACYMSPSLFRLFQLEQKRKDTDRLTVLQPVLKYISDHMDKRIKIPELAAAAGMSEKYFIHYFRTTLGVTPNTYINQLKMNRARVYIYQSQYTVRQIAYMLGYSDQYNFSRAFKKYFSIAPSKFV